MASSSTCLSALARPTDMQLRPTARDPRTPPSPLCTSAARSPHAPRGTQPRRRRAAALAVASSPARPSRMPRRAPSATSRRRCRATSTPTISASASRRPRSSSTATFASARAPRSSRAGASCATGTRTPSTSRTSSRRAICPRAATSRADRAFLRFVPGARHRHPRLRRRGRGHARRRHPQAIVRPGDELSYPGTLTKRGGRFDAGVGPVPASLSGRRELEFVLKNTANVDKSLLFDVEILAVEGSEGGGKGFRRGPGTWAEGIRPT